MTGAVASHGAWRIIRAQVPVTICGLPIQPGDLLHGDVNGLISVPESAVAEGYNLVEVIADQDIKITWVEIAVQ